MSSTNSLWYRLGFALERGRQLPSTGSRKLAGLRERMETRPEPSEKEEGASGASVDDAITAGAVALAARALDAWHPRKGAGPASLLKAAASGAVAALLVELARPLLNGRVGVGSLGDGAAARLARGAGQGLVYGAAAARWIPGPPVLKGTLYGSAEYLTVGVGGLPKLLGRRTPLRHVPPLLDALEGADEDRAYLEHVAFGIALAVLYGSDRASNGIDDDDGS